MMPRVIGAAADALPGYGQNAKGNKVHLPTNPVQRFGIVVIALGLVVLLGLAADRGGLVPVVTVVLFVAVAALLLAVERARTR